jgi:TRAP-type C4-dicarboxylate transport system permease small subunit
VNAVERLMTRFNVAISFLEDTLPLAIMNLIYCVCVLVATFGLIITQFILWSGLGIILERRNTMNLKGEGDERI